LGGFLRNRTRVGEASKCCRKLRVRRSVRPVMIKSLTCGLPTDSAWLRIFKNGDLAALRQPLRCATG
jgi:hypothetical protein